MGKILTLREREREKERKKKRKKETASPGPMWAVCNAAVHLRIRRLSAAGEQKAQRRGCRGSTQGLGGVGGLMDSGSGGEHVT